MSSVSMVSAFAYRTGPHPAGRGMLIVLGLQSATLASWFGFTPSLACQVGRALLAAGGEKPQADDTLDRFRAARAEIDGVGSNLAEAAERHGIDADLLAAWIERTKKSAEHANQ